MDQRVVIIGGGIAGLATAYQLHRDGIPFLVLERRDRPGGVILSEEIDGFTVDGGPDALLVQKPAGIALCQEYKVVPDWPALPAGWNFGEVASVATRAGGNVLVFHRGPHPIMEADGRTHAFSSSRPFEAACDVAQDRLPAFA